MAPSIKFDEDQLSEVELDLVIQEENGIYVAHIPALDLSTHGDSVEDAAKAATETAIIFIKEIIKMGTMDQVLTELGWKKMKGKENAFPYLPPHLIHRSVSLKNSCHA